MQYFGCKHIQESVKMHDGGLATTMVYDMEDFLQQCIDKYKALATAVGSAPKLPKVDTPCVAEESSLSPQGAPASTGPIVECHWCKHAYPPPSVYKNIGDWLLQCVCSLVLS